MLIRQWWREQRLLTLGYLLLVVFNAAASVLMWPYLRDQIPAFVKIIPFEPLQQFVQAMDTDGFWAYFCVQHLWKGAGFFGIAAAGLMGSGLVAREVDNRTAEFLLSRPVSRSRILWTRVGVSAVLLVAPLFVATLVSYRLAPRVDEVLELGPALAATAHVSLYSLMAFAATVALSARSSHALKPAMVVLGAMLASFAIYLVRGLWDWSLYNLIDLDHLLPLHQGVFPWRPALEMLGATSTFLGVAWWSFERRDF